MLFNVKKTKQVTAELKELMKEKKSADNKKKMAETIIDENSFTILIWDHIMVNKHKSKTQHDESFRIMHYHSIFNGRG